MSDKGFDVRPYKGLMPYSEEDAPFFFGRDVERHTITSNLTASRLTLLYGGSGVGKSSILRAGVAHHLRRLARENLDEGGMPGFAVAVFSEWRDDPVAALTVCVRDSVIQALDGQSPDLVKPRDSLVLTLQSWAELVGGELYIILDQFEEYFLYHGQEDGKGTFAVEFPRLVNHPDVRVNSLISIRNDAYSRLGRFQGRISNLFDNYLSVEHLSQDAARSAIVNPIEQYNRLYAAGRQRISIEPHLVDEVIEQLKTGKVFLGEAGRGIIKNGGEAVKKNRKIETPFLQLVMTRLWDEEIQFGSTSLRLATLKRLGGAESIVQTHLDKTMEAMQRDEQEVASRIFYHLVTPSGTKIAQNISDLATYAELPETQVSHVVNSLYQSESRVLRPVPAHNEPGESRCEIFHDVLAAAILDWRARYVRKQETAQLERKAERQARWLVAAALVIVAALGLTIYINQLRHIAKEAQDDAEAQKRNAQQALSLVRLTEHSIPFLETILRGHTGSVNSAAFSPDGRLVITASLDGTARIWDLNTSQSKELRGHTGAVNSAQFSPDGKLAITASIDETARIWDVTTGQSVELHGHTGRINSAEFSPDGKQAVTASVDGTARIWDVGTLQSKELRGHSGAVNSAQFSPDGGMVVTASTDGTARIWDAASGRSIVSLRGHVNVVVSATFSHNGRVLATASVDHTARLWDVASGRNLAELIGHTDAVSTAVFSRDGEFVLTASSDKTARVWEARTGEPIVIFSGHTDRVISAQFSPDGQQVITASEDMTARVWEANSGRSLAELRGHTSRVNSVAVSYDGRLAATASGDGTASGDTTARVWLVPELGGFRVSRASLEIDPNDYSGPCPATIRLLGRLSVVGGSGTVKYKFVRTNGVEGRENTVTFDSPGTKDVSTTWNFGGPQFPAPFGTFYIQVISPQELKSNDADFKIKCDSFYEQLPAPQIGEDSVSISRGVATVQMKWSPLVGATSYTVEVEVMGHSFHKRLSNVTNTVYAVSGVPQGKIRWRVWGVDETGREGSRSEWRYPPPK